jgi:hypothetical protein
MSQLDLQGSDSIAVWEAWHFTSASHVPAEHPPHRPSSTYVVARQEARLRRRGLSPQPVVRNLNDLPLHTPPLPHLHDPDRTQHP